VFGIFSILRKNVESDFKQSVLICLIFTPELRGKNQAKTKTDRWYGRSVALLN
jgi:hypothetical protein